MSNLRDRKRRHDRFYHRAKKENFASRAVYKLEALDRQHRLLRQGLRVLDLGCWPGGWLQYAAERVGPGGRVVGVDLTAVTLALPKQVTVLQGDIYELAPEALLAEAGDLEAFDVVLSDMAPHTTGIRFSDVARSVALVERALAIARETLVPGGSFLAKVFVGSGFDDLLNQVKADFRRVRMAKPESSRKESPEQYIVATERRSPAPTEE
ncbi:MAG: RlmE family RNA methyltransferase [Polyangia bacterium]|jgi:23S rRNA (uridine2552-2'-O)-methyltransferase|nr:RlmE family RNA methyltransferase [Polyangia bacterium]